MSLIKNLVSEPSKNKKKQNSKEGSGEDDSQEEEKPLRPFVKSAYDLQRLRLEKLMKNPEKPVIIPEPPQEKDYMQTVPTFVRNVMGSSAGAGSGEFHVYRHLRRKEYARQKCIQARSRQEELDMEYQQKLEDNRRKAEEKTAKKRAKRMKKKQRAKRSKSTNAQNADKESQGDKNESESSEAEESDAEDETKIVVEEEKVQSLPAAKEQNAIDSEVAVVEEERLEECDKKDDCNEPNQAEKEQATVKVPQESDLAFKVAKDAEKSTTDQLNDKVQIGSEAKEVSLEEGKSVEAEVLNVSQQPAEGKE